MNEMGFVQCGVVFRKFGGRRGVMDRGCVGSVCRVDRVMGCRMVDASRMSVADEYKIMRSDDYAILQESAEFFVDAFWGASTTPNATEGFESWDLDGTTRRALVDTQLDDLKSRYGKLMGKRRLASSFYFARGKNGKIDGCIGVEVAVVVSVVGGEIEVLSRESGEQMFASFMSALPAPIRNNLRKASLAEIAEVVFQRCEEAQEGTAVKFSLHPIISNLAVASTARGRGLGQLLIRACEEQARQWNNGMFRDIWLIVEELNEPARRLYEEKLNYDVIWRNESSSAVRIRSTPSGIEVFNVPAAHLLMAKEL